VNKEIFPFEKVARADRKADVDSFPSESTGAAALRPWPETPPQHRQDTSSAGSQIQHHGATPMIWASVA